MQERDTFDRLARYYDPIMEHVDYDRWFLITTALAEFMPEDFQHLDAGCGTGVLLNMLRKVGWRSLGIDLSCAMLRAGRKRHDRLSLAAADLRALPFSGSIDFMTCLFDSMNFLLEEKDLHAALRNMSGALSANGLLYFDVVTERMVTEHFADQSWEEDNGGFTTRWVSSFDQRSGISETHIRVNSGDDAIIRERMYPLPFLKKAVEDAGLEVLALYDAETWNPPSRRSTRVDFIAMKGADARARKQLNRIRKEIKRIVY